MSSSSLDVFDFMADNTTSIVIFGYFRKNGFLEYKIKHDDFISIIKKYIVQKYNVKIGKNNIYIDPFKDDTVSYCNFADIISKQFSIIGRNQIMYV